jgi:hypothetical protein
MQRTIVSVLETVFEAVLTAGFLLLWLSVWPIWAVVRR